MRYTAVLLWLASSVAQLETSMLWPMFGGNPQHTGQSLQRSSASQPSVAWAFSFGGSWPAPSPAVSSTGTVYTASQGGVVALDGTTGALLWTTALPGSGSTPALSASGLVVFDGAVSLTAVSCVDGRMQWQWSSTLPFSPPTIVGDVVLAGSDDYVLYALNLSTGQELWKYKTSSFIRSAPAVSVDGSTVFVSSYDWTVSWPVLYVTPDLTAQLYTRPPSPPALRLEHHRRLAAVVAHEDVAPSQLPRRGPHLGLRHHRLARRQRLRARPHDREAPMDHVCRRSRRCRMPGDCL